jgi:heme A synthase
MRVSTVDLASQTRELAASRSFFASLAVTGLISTIALIMVGSIVRVTGNGLGCPDWPLCYGQAIPPLKMSAWVEFAHRLFGGAVVLQVAILIGLAWRRYRHEPWIFRTAVVASVVLTVQVVLGGIHVIYELPSWTGWVHTAVAMLLAGLLAVWVAVTHTGLRQIGERTAEQLRGTRLTLWTAVAAATTYILLLTGSLVTRTGASLVCPAFPYCGLSFVPDYLRGLVTIQMVHRVTAFIVAFTISLVLWHLLRSARRDPGLRRFALALVALLVLQFGLGMVNVWMAIPMWSRVLHLGTGGTIWVVVLMLAVVLYRGKKEASEARA